MKKPLCALIICIFSLNSLIGNESLPQALITLNQTVQTEVKDRTQQKRNWVLPKQNNTVLDVAIIGSGMAGTSVALGLILEGVNNIKIFDENKDGKEGPWNRCARMRYLRSGKFSMGPSMGIASLSFKSWFIAMFDEKAWENLNLIPTNLWADYLHWYKTILKLPVENEMVLKTIIPQDNYLELQFESNDRIYTVFARKVVLATGRDGFGKGFIPEYAKKIPKQYYIHTSECIAPQDLKDKQIVVVGAGASAFDAAATALEVASKTVSMLIRRSCLPNINKFSKLGGAGIQQGFYTLPDEQHIQIAKTVFKSGTPPPKSSIERICNYNNLFLKFNTQIQKIEEQDQQLMITTNHGEITCDFLIFATGYLIDGKQRPELSHFIDSILLWKDRTGFNKEDESLIGQFPYLGPHFQFQGKTKDLNPELKNIYCFNYGAFLSHGNISAEIPGISVGVQKLVNGIVSDFFHENFTDYFKSIENYQTPLFNPNDYF